jgi:phosphatidylserine/phosphatidylglycerophosphate/cardiolipin synthase-like enzyme
MNPTEIDAMLRQTLEDCRLSRSERRALGEVLDELAPSENQKMFLRFRAFALARAQVRDPEAAAVIEWLEEVTKVLSPAPPEESTQEDEACFSPGSGCPSRIAALFARAQREVDVCVFTITDNRISDAIVDAHRRGIRLRIITDDDKSLDPGSDVARLARMGIPLRMDISPYHMHHKFAVFDGQAVLTGSYNWTRSAAEHNEENFVICHNPNLIREFARVFDGLWKRLEV